jgi:hypothetical protein
VLPEEEPMAINHKKFGLYTIAGVVAAIVIIAAVFASGIEFPNSGANQKTGMLSVSIMDAPADLAHLNVTINGIYVQNDTGDSWIKLDFTGSVSSVYFDLLSLKNVAKDLSTSLIPVGNYSKIRLDVAAANATLNDGTTENLTVPPGHIDIIVSFEIKAGQTTNVLLDMQVDTVAISQTGNLKPTLKATVQYLP